MNLPFIPAALLPDTAQDPAWWYLFRGHQLLIQPQRPEFPIPAAAEIESLLFKAQNPLLLGTIGSRPCYTATLPTSFEPPAPWELKTLRELFTFLPEMQFTIAGRARQLLTWDLHHRYCGRCASPTRRLPTEHVRVCPSCQLQCYPRLSPAVIMSVTRGDEILLARAGKFPGKMHSVLAGFVEPGETLEEAVAREVMEETAIRVDNIRYFGSQPWPFPHSLMIAFTCEYQSGTLQIDGDEIVEAEWYGADNLPGLPNSVSIARRLIDDFLENHPDVAP